MELFLSSLTLQLDLRVNHTLIKDQFLWVRVGNSCCIIPLQIDIMFNSMHMIFLPVTYSAMAHGFQDLNNFESDPEEFARTFCKDLGVEDPEVGVREHNLLWHISFLKPN